MDEGAETTELRRGVLGPCVLALLAERPRFGLELVRDLSRADGLLTSEGTVYPLLNRLRDAGLVTSRWVHDDTTRPRRYYSITDQGRANLVTFRAEWSAFTAAVDGVLGAGTESGRGRTHLGKLEGEPRDQRAGASARRGLPARARRRPGRPA